MRRVPAAAHTIFPTPRTLSITLVSFYRVRLLLGLLLCSIAAVHPEAAVQSRLGLRAIDEALAIGTLRTPKERSAFHATYRLPVGVAPVDYIEVVTPFRRIALTAEQRRLAGHLSFGQKQARDLIGQNTAIVELWVELSFHPLNSFVGVPAYDVALSQGGSTQVDAVHLDRVPRFGARVEGTGLGLAMPGGALPGVGAQPLTGGTLIATFEERQLDLTGTYLVRVTERGALLGTAVLNLAGLR